MEVSAHSGRPVSGISEAPARGRRAGGFTLIELIMVIVILGVLSATAIPRLFDFSTDAKKATTLALLGAIRTSISLYFTKASLPPPTGGSRPWWPTGPQLASSDSGPGAVLETKMPDNPFATCPSTSKRNDIYNNPTPGQSSYKGYDDFDSALKLMEVIVIPDRDGNIFGWRYSDSTATSPVPGQPYPRVEAGKYGIGLFYALSREADSYLY